MSILIFVVGIILLIGLIVTHEFGHFIAARRNGVDVEEFGIFFPPAIYKRKTKGGWIFSINILPLGGFVKLKGEHDSDTQKGSYGAASLWVKTKIMAAGVTMNLATALILLTILGVVGMPSLLPNQFTVKSNTKTVSQRVLIGGIESGSPAAKAGLKDEDQLVAIGKPGEKPVKVNSANNLPNITKSFAGDTVKVYFIRSGKAEVTTANLLSTSVVRSSDKIFDKEINSTKLNCATIKDPKAYLGVSPTQYTLQRSTWSAPVTAVVFSAQAAALTFQGLGHAIGGLGSLIAGTVTGNSVARSNGECSATSELTGPVGIVVILKDTSHLGFVFMLYIIAIISLTLAIMNILPIPALDGGRLWLTLLMRGVKKPISAKKEELINVIGIVILLALTIVITIVDVHRF